jgi:CHAT domain-containing protein
VPEEFEATERLITGMLEARKGQSLGSSLAEAQASLMADARSSHPFYWGAFIILGDGARSLTN